MLSVNKGNTASPQIYFLYVTETVELNDHGLCGTRDFKGFKNNKTKETFHIKINIG